ncbi:MAG: hypothetical protein AB7O80_03825, partial [Acetobacteraceae bacterium]
LTTTEPIYHLGENLYLVKIPEGTAGRPREIEGLFEPSLLAKRLGGKSFSPKKDHGDETHYGKVAFAESVVRPNARSVDFSGFEDLLARIESVIRHYACIPVGTRATATTVAMPATSGAAAIRSA